jgi:hypothetical protein
VLPRRIGFVVDVAIRTVQIAAGCNLEDELVDIRGGLHEFFRRLLKKP